MGRIVRKLWNGLTAVLVVLMVLLALLLAAPRLLGIQVYAVLSGSMEPTYSVGTLLYVRETDPAGLEPGQVITYFLDADTVVTHRIAETVTDEYGSLCYRTKGDANDAADAVPVRQEQIIGTPVFSVPYLGYLGTSVQTRAGMYRLIAAACVLAVLIILPELFTKEKTEKDRG